MKKIIALVGLGLGVLAAVVYFASMADYSFPGIAASLIASWQGLGSEASAQYPLMTCFAKLLGGGNLIAPIAGVVAVLLFYKLVATFVTWASAGSGSVRSPARLGFIAATVATVVFIFTPAVHEAASHVEPRMFDFAWALFTFAIALPFFGKQDKFDWLLPILLGVLAALGALDSAIFIAFLPFYFALVVAVPMRHDHKAFVAPIVFIVVFVIVLLLGARIFADGVIDYFRSAADELRTYKDTPGWGFVTIFSLVPFLAALLASWRAFHGATGVVQWFFHLAMTFAAILAIATPLSPGKLMEPYGILPVATSAFAAALAGYLAAYWYYQRRHIVGLAAGGTLVFVLVVMVFWNLFAFDGGRGAFADKVAERILTDLGNRQWMISDGLLDDHLQILAAKKGQKLYLINIARDLDHDYLESLAKTVKAAKLGGSKNDELAISLNLGVMPFVQDWFACDPSVAQDVAIFGAPDLWQIAGLKSVPEFLFFGADEKRVPDWTSWKEFDKLLEVPKGWGSYHDRLTLDPIARFRYSLRRHLGFVANNRGVYLQDQGDADGAFKMYELVLNEIDRDNLCAMFNEVEMIGAKHPAAVAKKRDLDRMLKTAIEDQNRRYILWRLGTYYGYIRNPDVFIRLGYTWAKSGRPGDALAHLRRAIEFVPSDRRAGLMGMMASLYARQNEQQKSREIFERILKANAKDHDALIGMMQLSLQDGDADKAIEYLNRAAAIGDNKKRALTERAMVAMLRNDSAGAKEIIKKAIDLDNTDLHAWSLLAASVLQQHDSAKETSERRKYMQELEKEIVPQMQRMARDRDDYNLHVTKGMVSLRKGDEKARKEARTSFVNAAKARPDIPVVQDLVLELDISLDDPTSAKSHAVEVLRRNRNAPLANYVMGSIAMGEGKLNEAESYLRKAADAPQPVAFALNDLAELYRRQKHYDLAERYARQAVKRAPELSAAWDTLGSVLMDSNQKLDEAAAAIRRAYELSKDAKGREGDVRILISLARVQLKQGEKLPAKLTIRKVQSRLGELTEFERGEFNNLIKNAR